MFRSKEEREREMGEWWGQESRGWVRGEGGQGLLPNPPTGIVHQDEPISHHQFIISKSLTNSERERL